MGGELRLIAAVLIGISLVAAKCPDEDRDNFCANAETFCQATSPNPWPIACDGVPSIPCEAVEVYEMTDWPCPCVIDGLASEHAVPMEMPR